MKRLFILFSGLLSLVIAGVLSVAIIIAIKTKEGPLDLTFLKPTLDRILSQSTTDVSVATLELQWKTFKDPLLFKARDVQIFDHHEEKLWIGQLDLVYPLSGLLKTKGVPTHCTIDGMRAHIQSSSVGEVTTNKPLVDIDFTMLNHKLLSLQHIKSLRLRHTHLTLQRGQKILDLKIEGQIDQAKTTRHGHFLIDIQDTPSVIDMTVDMPSDQNIISVSFHSQDMKSETLYRLLDVKTDGFGQFENSTLSLSYIYNYKTDNHKGHLSCLLDQVTIQDKSLWTEAIHLPQLHLKLSLDQNTLTLQPTDIILNDVLFILNAQGNISQKHDVINIHVDAKSNQLSFEKVPGLWPKGAAEGPRHWITSNMKTGRVPQATFAMDAQIDFKKTDSIFQVRTLGGDIHLEDTTLTYHADMKPVTKLKAIAHYDHDHFDISILSASHNDLTLSDGRVKIGRFQDPISTLSIDTTITGDLKKAMEIIDQNPLKLADKIGVKASDIQGLLEGRLAITFPLLDEFDTTKIETHFKGHSKMTSLMAYQNIPINFQYGDLQIILVPAGISVEGVGQLSTLPMDLKISQDFITNQTNVKINTLISDPVLAQWHKGLPTLFQGQAPTTITYNSTLNQNGRLLIHSDLSKVALNTLIMKKDMGTQGSLEASAVFNGKSFHPDMPVHYQDKTGWVIDVTLPETILSVQTVPRTPFNFTASFDGVTHLRGSYHAQTDQKSTLTLKGSSLDLKTYLATDLSVFDTDPRDTSPPPSDFTIQFDADRMTVGRPLGIKKPSLFAHLINGKLEKLKFIGETQEGIGINHDVYCELLTHEKGVRKLRLQTEQGGALLKACGIFNTIRGGQLELFAVHDPHFHADEWIGKMRVRSFALLETPFIARLLSLIPAGTSTLTHNKGIIMELLKMRFGISKSYIHIHGLRAEGVSLGISLSGLIERQHDQTINLKGTMVPMRALNTAISKIPLLGQLITGGTNDGLFSITFGVGGTMDRPNISSNPVSVLTPGIMKKIFAGRGDHFVNSDKWLNSPDQHGGVFDQEFSGQ